MFMNLRNVLFCSVFFCVELKIYILCEFYILCRGYIDLLHFVMYQLYSCNVRTQRLVELFFVCVGLDLQCFLFCLSQAPSIEKDDEYTVGSSPNRRMTTYSQHYFGSIEDSFSIRIIEVLINPRSCYIS